MSEISNEQIYSVLLDLKSGMGSVQSTLEAHQTAFEKHLTDDAAVKEDVTAIRLKLANQSGAGRVWSLVATAVASAASALGTYFLSHHK